MSQYIVWEEGDDPAKAGLEIEAWDSGGAAELAAERCWISCDPRSEIDFMVKDTETGVVEEFTVNVEFDPIFTARKTG